MAALTNPPPPTTAGSSSSAAAKVVEEEPLPPPTPIIRVEMKRLEELLERLVEATKNANVHQLEKIHVALSQVKMKMSVLIWFIGDEELTDARWAE